MTHQKHKIYGIIAGMLLAAAAMPAAYAQVFYPPSASLSAGDITSNHILNGTIVNVDVNASAAIDATKLRGGTPAGGILLANGNAIATSSLFFYATSTNRLGIGTSTPSDTLAVHGGALISGSSFFGAAIVGTSTLNITGLTTLGNASTSVLTVSGASFLDGGVTLVCTACITDANVADSITLTNLTQITTRAISDTTGTLTTARGGTNSTTYNGSLLLATDSAGTSIVASSSPGVGFINATSTTATSTFYGGLKLSKANTGIEFNDGTIQTTSATGDWQQLGETVLGANAETIAVNDFAARDDLRIVVHIVGSNVNGRTRLFFNKTRGTGYSFIVEKNNAADTSTADTNSWALSGEAAAETKPKWFVVNVGNAAGYVKLGSWRGAAATDATAVPTVYEGTGLMASTTQQITSVSVTAAVGDLLNTDSRITVYGKKD